MKTDIIITYEYEFEPQELKELIQEIESLLIASKKEPSEDLHRFMYAWKSELELEE